MTAKTMATRAGAIAASVARLKGDDFLMRWEDSEYIEAQCQLIADVFGVDDPKNARSEVWEEMRIAFEADKRRADAERIAHDVWESGHSEAAEACENEIRAMLAAAVFAAIQEKENTP